MVMSCGIAWALLSTEGCSGAWSEGKMGFPKLVTVPDNGGWMAGFTLHIADALFLQTRTVAVSHHSQVNGCSRGGLLGAFVSGLWLCLSLHLHPVVWTSGWSFGLAGPCEAQQLL